MTPLSITLFTTSTCVHCAPVKKSLEELAEKYGENMFLKTHTIDKNPAALKIAKEWKVKGVPTMILILNGEEIGTVVGAHTKERLDELIQGCLQSYIFQESSNGSDDSSDSVLCGSGESPNAE